MEEKCLECLMMLQIHWSDTPSIDAVIERFAATAARRLNFLIWTYTCTSTSVCIVQYNRQFLRHFKYIIPWFQNHINKTRNVYWSFTSLLHFWPPPIFNPGYARDARLRAERTEGIAVPLEYAAAAWLRWELPQFTVWLKLHRRKSFYTPSVAERNNDLGVRILIHAGHRRITPVNACICVSICY